MLRVSLIFYGSGFLRTVGKGNKATVAAAAAVSAKAASSSAGRGKKATAQSTDVMEEDSTRLIHASDSTRSHLGDEVAGEASHPPYGATASNPRRRRSQRSDEDVLQVAQRMQRRDVTGEVPVASFAYEILKAHPSVRQMGLRERMAFLCDRWERLRKEERQVYLDDPLKGLL
ncbi:hypothetical protein TRSC58_02487 [Trypanosoma rangeli SC58]|uniref:Uncharacterized protein n=1 Tax=Trypanosoma rangeli SC58 TaxID=429131 RepID=A0A061J2X2_TRYRA|nr:hypothetical protein TRSC58_02487 [Trypanosoma rangeli SC58]